MKSKKSISSATVFYSVMLALALVLPGEAFAQLQYGDFTYEVSGGTVTITGYNCPGGAAVIPASINGKPVVGIGSNAFRNCTGLTSVTIPISVTSIGDEAFAWCSSLTSIVVDANNTVYSSQDGVLYDKAKTILIQYPGGKSGEFTIPSGVVSIGGGAFAVCSGLASVTIPNSVTSIGDEAFAWCSSLTSIVVDANNTVYSSQDGVLYDKAKTILIQYPGGKSGEFTIPSGVVSIGGGAFAVCRSLTSVTIPDSVTSIGDGAFRYCSSLTRIIIPDSVTSIEPDAFIYCTGLTNVTLGNSVKSIGQRAFSSCSSLTSVTIPDSVTSIEPDAFIYCTGLTNVTLGNSVKSIGYESFAYCRGLTSVTIPDKVTIIGNGAFTECTGLTSVTIGNSVKSIGQRAFSSCSSLTSVTIPDSVTIIGDGAFTECTGLTNIDVDTNNTAYSSQDGVLYNKDKTALNLYPCGRSGEFTIPSSVTSIRWGAFARSSGLTSVIITESVTNIGSGAFAECSSLTNIAIPDSVTSIGSGAFAGCISLTSVTIGNGVTSIGYGAFYECTTLTKAYFLGNAPRMEMGFFIVGYSYVYYGVFDYCANNFTVCYTAGSTGFTNPWYGYPTAACAEATSSTTSVPGGTTTTISEEECTVTVVSTILPLRAGQAPHVRRIVITGENSNWNRSTVVSIEDIKKVILLRVQPTKIIALIVVPSTRTGFMPGEKEVGVATGAELCTGTVEIP